MPGGDERHVTSRDIAREAGVSQPTVSRALRADPRVAPETARLVRDTARRLGYVPHAAARSLITRRAGTVAIVAADLNNPFYPELVEALRADLDRLGYRAVLLGEGGRGDEERDGLEPVDAVMRSGMVDGAIVATARLNAPTRRFLEEEPAPVVLVVREVPDCGRDAVVADNRGGAALAADLLLELGHARIGWIAGPEYASTAREREAGFLERLAEAGSPGDPGLRRGADSYSHRAGYEACAELLALPDPPTAVFCANDVVALGALDATRGLGVDVPGELSVVGFDDISLAGWEAFGLTTVHQPLAEMAREASSRLVELVEGGGEAVEPRRSSFPTRVVRRRTAAAPPSA